MPVKRYKKKPVEVSVLQWTGDNILEVIDFLAHSPHIVSQCHLPSAKAPYYIDIFTLEGKMSVSLNDYIIKGVEGEFYACKPHIFDKTYQEA